MKFNKLLVLFLTFTLAGCGAFSGATPSPLPTVAFDNNTAPTQTSPQVSGAGVTASGIVVPAQEAQLAFALGGIVQTVNVAVGDRVKAGDVLATLGGDEQLQAAISKAESDILAAQQALADLQKPQPLELVQAQSALEDAQTALDDLLHPSNLAVSQAKKAVLDAQDALDTAQKYVNYLIYGRASQEQLSAAQAAYVVAQAEVDRLQALYEKTRGDPSRDPAKALALSNLVAAEAKRDRALATLNWLKGKPSQLETDQKYNDLALAQARLADAQETLQKLTNPSAADVALAQATLEDAQKNLADLQAGPDPEQLTLLQARLKSAQDQATAAHASLLNLEIKAPFAGVVVRLTVHAGEWVIPGQPVLALVDMDHLRIETTDLSELDIPKIAIGQPVTVIVKALNQEATGRVSLISPLADSLGGDVVYRTTIELDTTPPGLRLGMSVEVQFGLGQ